MEATVQHLLITEIDHMIARAQQRAEQQGTHTGLPRGDAARKAQRTPNNVQRSLDRLRSYRRALATERRPGTNPSAPAHARPR